MPLARLLRDQAVMLSASLKKDLADLAVEKRVLDVSPKTESNAARLVQVLAEMKAAEEGTTRLHDYNPEIQRPFDCPYCWIIEGKRHCLQPADGKTEAAACPTCTSEYALDG